MTAIKYDVTDVPEGGGGEQPQPAMYKGKIVQVTHRLKKSNNDPTNDLEVVVDVGPEYARLWTYIQLENPASAWKLREFTDALGLPPKGSIDPAKISREQPEVNVKVSADTDLDGNYRGRVKNLFKPGKVSDTDDDTPATAGAEDYTEWTVDDLTKEIEDRGLDMPTGRKTVAKLAEVLAEDDATTAEAQQGGGDDDQGPVDTGPGADLPEGYEDIDDWEDQDLKDELEKLELKVTGRFSAQKARDLIIEHVSENGTTPPAEEDDYDTWELSELLEEVQTRIDQGAEIEISGRKTKEKVIAAMREDDQKAF